MDPEEQRGERELELDPGEHEAVPQVQAAHREEPGLHAHELQPGAATEFVRLLSVLFLTRDGLLVLSLFPLLTVHAMRHMVGRCCHAHG